MATRKPEENSAEAKVSPLARYGFLAAFGSIALSVGVLGIYSGVIARSESSEIGAVLQGIQEDKERLRPYLDWTLSPDGYSANLMVGFRGRW